MYGVMVKFKIRNRGASEVHSFRSSGRCLISKADRHGTCGHLSVGGSVESVGEHSDDEGADNEADEDGDGALDQEVLVGLLDGRPVVPVDSGMRM